MRGKYHSRERARESRLEYVKITAERNFCACERRKERVCARFAKIKETRDHSQASECPLVFRVILIQAYFKSE